MKKLLAIAAAATAVTALAAPAQAAPGQRGKVLNVQPLTNAAALPSARANHLVTYVSEGVTGRPIKVTGTVALPRTPAPPGGHPVITWTHGTTGNADLCAPSQDTPDGPAHGYLSITQKYLDKWVAKGYAVVQTDYEGLGTPGGHPYMNGTSAANTAIDMVRAARAVDRRVGRGYFVIGHSQGGHAALFTAAARQRPKDVDLKGSVALAPGSMTSQTPDYVRTGRPGAGAAMSFLFIILNGAKAADPSLDVDGLLTGEAAAILKAGRTTACNAQLAEMSRTLAPEKVFKPDADLGPLTAYLRTQEPMGLTLKVPTLVVQGAADTQVSTPATDAVVKDLCSRYKGITYNHYEGADHRGVIEASYNDAFAYVEALRRGRAPQPTC
ncbi:alpha/beta hydrolase family protein [Actinomadura sp. 21ATH]|uniref:alpha/beta hydrolase family protein n=1 Tax=Actinomadura sp. 21ATH TaxID=1735444 RepID=UPI0035C17E85